MMERKANRKRGRERQGRKGVAQGGEHVRDQQSGVSGSCRSSLGAGSEAKAQASHLPLSRTVLWMEPRRGTKGGVQYVLT